jgi:uncharacterized protein YbcI
MSLNRPPGSEPREMPRPAPGAPPAEPGDVVSAVISEQIVQLYLEAFGRGPTHARTYVQPQFTVCGLRDVFTVAERSLIAGGGEAEVEAARGKINEAIDRKYVSIVEVQTGRSVLSHLPRTRVAADVAVHFFLFDDVSVARDALDR